jgi:hypothetical protein
LLTRCKTSNFEKISIDKSSILKIAVNRADYQSNYRLFYDSFHWRSYFDHIKNEIFVTRKLESENINNKENFMFFEDALTPCTSNSNELFMEHSSLIPSIDLAIKLGGKDILLIADNNVDNINFLKEVFEPEINKTIQEFREYANIYQFSKGNFNLPVKSIEEFTKE